MMKKLFSVLMALCLLCTAASALAEETPTWEKMPQVVTVDEGVELTDADFEGDWIADKVFYGTDYLTPEEVEAKGLAIRPVRIAGGKVINIVTDEAGEHEVSAEYTLENNQILFTDGEGIPPEEKPHAAVFLLSQGLLCRKIAVSAKTLPYKNTCTGQQPKTNYPNFEERRC